MWERWSRGESLKAIGRIFGKEGGSVFGQLAPSGGIRRRPRRRSPLALSWAEREEVARGVAAGQSMRFIARALSRAASTVSREIERNGGGRAYRATEAEERRLGSSAASQALSAVVPPEAAATGRRPTAEAWVARADRRLVEAPLS